MSATTTMTANSAPLTHDVGEALEKAFTNVTGNLTETVEIVDNNGASTGKKKPRFIIQSHGYLDVRAYVAAGLAFPKDAGTFESLHPKDGLKPLNDLDPNVYQLQQETENVMVRVYDSCDDFNKNSLPNFRTITNETIVVSQLAIQNLTGLGDGSFQAMLNILTDDKYSEPGSEETDEFQGAAQTASDILFDMRKTAKEKAETIKGLAGSITSYGNKVQTIKDDVDKVVTKFQGEEAKDGQAAVAGIMSKLNTELENCRTALKKAVDDANSAKADYDYDKKVADTSVAYIWIPFFGWISGTTVLITYNKKAQAAWNEYQKQLGLQSDDKKEIASLEAVIGAVNMLSQQNKTMSDQISRAQVALKEIQKVFEEMGRDLERAAELMGAAKGYVRKSLFARKRVIKSRIDEAVKDYQDTIDAAQELLDTDSNIQTSGITPDVSAPKVE
ncbi:unnamed protein product [Fusarium langsethiae]|nr:unnamed protein product [Fusarium langsethiae]